MFRCLRNRVHSNGYRFMCIPFSRRRIKKISQRKGDDDAIIEDVVRHFVVEAVLGKFLHAGRENEKRITNGGPSVIRLLISNSLYY